MARLLASFSAALLWAAIIAHCIPFAGMWLNFRFRLCCHSCRSWYLLSLL